MATGIYENQFDFIQTGYSGVSLYTQTGNFFFPSGTLIYSGLSGDVSQSNYFLGVPGYSPIVLPSNTNFSGVVDFTTGIFINTTGISGTYFLPNGTIILSGINGDITTDFADYGANPNYTRIVINNTSVSYPGVLVTGLVSGIFVSGYNYNDSGVLYTGYISGTFVSGYSGQVPIPASGFTFSGVQDFPIYTAIISGTDLGLFASGIYNDLMLDSPSPFSIPYISGWLMNHIGEFNTMCEANFGTASGFAFPPMNFKEIAIYQEMFTAYYYKRCATNLLGAAAYGRDWTSLTEADSKLTRVSKNELAKTFRGFANDSEERIKFLAGQYRQFNGVPLQVVGDDTIPGPFRDRYDNIYGSYNGYFPYYNIYFTRAVYF